MSAEIPTDRSNEDFRAPRDPLPSDRSLSSEQDERRERADQLFPYIGGAVHIHPMGPEGPVEGPNEEPGETSLTLERAVRYQEEEIDRGVGKATFLVATGHAEHIGRRLPQESLVSLGLSPEEAQAVVKANSELTQGRGFEELDSATRNALRKASSLELNRECEEIARLNSRPEKKVTVYSGTEATIEPGAKLTIDDATLSRLDIAIASVHSGGGDLYQNSTEGLVNLYRSVIREHPAINVIGHPIKGNMKEIIADLQERSQTNDGQGFRDVLGPLMQLMAQAGVAFEINLKDPLPGLQSGHRDEGTVLRGILALAKEYGTPLSIGIDWHLFRHWQDTGKAGDGLSEKDQELLQRSVNDWGNMTPQERLESEQLREKSEKGGLGVRLWLRLAHLNKVMKEMGIESSQVVNSSEENIKSWLAQRKEKIENPIHQ